VIQSYPWSWPPGLAVVEALSMMWQPLPPPHDVVRNGRTSIVKLTVAGRVQPGGATTELALPDASFSLVLASGPVMLPELLAAVEDPAALLAPAPALELAPDPGSPPMLLADVLAVDPLAVEPAALDAAAPPAPELSPPTEAELAPADPPPLLLAAPVV
jgi:hypothetical protein